MRYRVYLTDEAQKDLLDIHAYVSSQDDLAKADRLLDHLEQACSKLSYLPMKGHAPIELKRIGVEQYREVQFKPYRVLYEVVQDAVYVHAILDGRRDLQSLWERRLLR